MNERGSTSVEATLLVPVLMVLVLFVISLGRTSQAGIQVRHAADQGARAASLVAQPRMAAAASSAALADLRNNGVACVSPTVTTAVGASSGIRQVTVTVRCTVDRQGLSLLNPASRTVSGSSTEVIDVHRAG